MGGRSIASHSCLLFGPRCYTHHHTVPKNPQTSSLHFLYLQYDSLPASLDILPLSRDSYLFFLLRIRPVGNCDISLEPIRNPIRRSHSTNITRGCCANVFLRLNDTTECVYFLRQSSVVKHVQLTFWIILKNRTDKLFLLGAYNDIYGFLLVM